MIDEADRAPHERTRMVIPVTCTVHGGARGFSNLVVSKRDGVIELDPRAVGACVIVFDENAATQLFRVLGEWLGAEPVAPPYLR
ncbi:MAG: hypothetical protein ACRDSR_23530 [Pseudonocardiaceae bacterium]